MLTDRPSWPPVSGMPRGSDEHLASARDEAMRRAYKEMMAGDEADAYTGSLNRLIKTDLYGMFILIYR